MQTLPFYLIKKLLAREANRCANPFDLPKLSLALSSLDDNQIWIVKDIDNNDIAKVNGESVDWIDSEI